MQRIDMGAGERWGAGEGLVRRDGGRGELSRPMECLCRVWHGRDHSVC